MWHISLHVMHVQTLITDNIDPTDINQRHALKQRLKWVPADWVLYFFSTGNFNASCIYSVIWFCMEHENPAYLYPYLQYSNIIQVSGCLSQRRFVFELSTSSKSVISVPTDLSQFELVIKKLFSCMWHSECFLYNQQGVFSCNRFHFEASRLRRSSWHHLLRGQHLLGGELDGTRWWPFSLQVCSFSIISWFISFPDKADISWKFKFSLWLISNDVVLCRTPLGK